MCRDERSSNKSCKLKWSEKQFDLLKNRGKITKIQTFDWGYDTGKNYFGDNEIIYYFNQFLIILKQLLIVSAWGSDASCHIR